MNDRPSPIEFFVKESIAHARSLPLQEAILFLQGLAESCTDSDVVARIHKLAQVLSESDRQLELIQSGQLKLNLDGHGKKGSKP